MEQKAIKGLITRVQNLGKEIETVAGSLIKDYHNLQDCIKKATIENGEGLKYNGVTLAYTGRSQTSRVDLKKLQTVMADLPEEYAQKVASCIVTTEKSPYASIRGLPRFN